MRDTPETDAACWMQDWEGYRGEIINSNFARRLERERDAARKDADNLASELQQALRQWSHYSEQYEEDDLEKSDHVEGQWYRIAKEALAVHAALNPLKPTVITTDPSKMAAIYAKPATQSHAEAVSSILKQNAP